MISGLISGLKAYMEGSEYYSRPFFIKYLLISGVLSLAAFLLLVGLIYEWGDNLGLALASGVSGNNAISGVVSSVISVLSVLLLWLVIIFIFKYIILIVVAPVMSVLSERVESDMTGEQVSSSLSISNQLYLMARGVRIALSNLARELIITIGLLLASLIPGTAIITTPLIFIVQAYYAGFGNLDLFMERHFDRKESRSFVSRHRGEAIANGSVFLLLLLIPFVGAFMAPSLATVAATVSGVKLLEEEELLYN